MKKSSTYFRTKKYVKISLLMILISFACWSTYQASAYEPCEIKIFTRNSRVNLDEIKAFFKTVDIVIMRMLPHEKKNRLKKPGLYTVVLMKEKDFKKAEIIDEKKKGIRFYLPENIFDWAKNDQITAKLVTAILLKKCGYDADKKHKNIPRWLKFGILAKVKRRLDKGNIPGIITYPGVHMLLTTEPAPDLLKIASSPVKPVDGPAYDIFLETSEILLSSVRRLPKSREGIKDIVELSIKGLPPKASFSKVFGKKVHQLLQNTTEISKLNRDQDTEDELKEWLNDSAVLMSVNPFKPGNANFAEKQFRKIEIVRYTSAIPSPQNTKEERYCMVEHLKEKKDEIKNFPSVVKDKEIEFARLEFAVPSSIQSSLNTIKKALLKLRTDSSFKFKSAYLEAKKDFYDEVEQYNEIEYYLKQMEPRFVPESWRYRTELQELDKWHQKTKLHWPALTEYLDTIEKDNKLK